MIGLCEAKTHETFICSPCPNSKSGLWNGKHTQHGAKEGLCKIWFGFGVDLLDEEKRMNNLTISKVCFPRGNYLEKTVRGHYPNPQGHNAPNNPDDSGFDQP